MYDKRANPIDGTIRRQDEGDVDNQDVLPGHPSTGRIEMKQSELVLLLTVQIKPI